MSDGVRRDFVTVTRCDGTTEVAPAVVIRLSGEVNVVLPDPVFLRSGDSISFPAVEVRA